MKNDGGIGPTEYDLRLLVLSQQQEFRDIRSRSSRVIQLIVSVISLAGSYGLLRILTSNDITLSFEIPDSAFNRCLPTSVDAAGVSVVGVGIISALLAGVLSFVVIIFLIELWFVNGNIQQLDSPRPTHYGDLFLNDYGGWIEHNAILLDTANRKYRILKKKVYYSITFAIMAAGILYFIYFDEAYLLISLDILIAVGCATLSLYWGYNFISGVSSGEDISYLFFEQSVSAGSYFSIVIATVVSIEIFLNLFDLITKFVIC